MKQKNVLNCRKIASNKINRSIIPKEVIKTSKKNSKKILNEMCQFYQSYPKKDRINNIYKTLTPNQYKEFVINESNYINIVDSIFRNKTQNELNTMALSFKKNPPSDIKFTQNELFEFAMDKYDEKIKWDIYNKIKSN